MPTEVESKEKKKAGAPTKYNLEDEDLEMVTNYCLLGSTMEELADFLGVHKDTIYEWKKVHPKFSDAIKKGKGIAGAKVAASLFKRAMGFSYEETTHEPLYNQAGEAITNEPVLKKVVTKMVVPDVGAQMAFLKNRHGSHWRDKQTVEVVDDLLLLDRLSKAKGRVDA